MGERMMAGYIAIAAAAAVVCLVAIFAARRHYEKRVKETYRHLLETLDRALSGKRGDVRFDESMDAALTERLNRLLRAYDVNHDAAGQERDAMNTLICRYFPPDTDAAGQHHALQRPFKRKGSGGKRRGAGRQDTEPIGNSGIFS